MPRVTLNVRGDGMTGRAGKTRNIWLVWLVWPLITLGIYHLVWYYKINREARDFDEKIDVEPTLSLLAVAIGWIMGIGISACYLGFGISSLRTDSGWWLTYYVDVAAMQFLRYRFMRRHNVGPPEPAGSSGLSGMLVSALTAPIYARSLIRVVFRRKLSFTVTAKGSSASPDRLWSFRYSLMWAAVPVALLVIASLHHRPYLMMIAWTGIILLVCLAPVAIWLFDRARAARVAAPRRAKYRRPAESAELTAVSCAR